jgi:uncharacterized membrane protein
VLNSIEWYGNRARCSRLAAVIALSMVSLAGCGGGGSNGSSGNNCGNPPPPAPPPPGGGAQVDTTPPSTPSGLTAAALSSSEISLSWSSATDEVGVSSYKVYRGGAVIATIPSTSYSESGLTAATQYCYDVTATDAAGNESAHSTQSCATTTAPTAPADTTKPTVTSTRPASDASDVAVQDAITAVFSEPMDAATLTQTTFSVVDANKTPVVGTVTYAGTTATFSPAELLAPSETYTATIAADVKDVAGNTLASARTWTFKTGLATYSLTAVGEDPAGDDEELFTLLTDLNEKGEVTGEAVRNWNLNSQTPRQESIAFLWREGRLIDLGSLSASERQSRSQGINDQSEVVGLSLAGPGNPPAFRWRENEMTAIGLEDAYAINNTGQVVGYVRRTQGDEAISVAVAWKSGQLTDLTGLVNPWNINDAGDIVGFSYVEDRTQASLWRAGVLTPLGLLPGALTSQAFDINKNGVIVGTNEFAPPASTTDYSRAFLWQSGRMTELPRIANSHTSSEANGINDRGDVVGRSGATSLNATVWLDGAAYDLNELIAADDPLKPYIKLAEALEINNRGQIIVQGTDSRRSGSYSGYLLTPKRSK